MVVPANTKLKTSLEIRRCNTKSSLIILWGNHEYQRIAGTDR